ncbi:MAG: sulfotransferase [Azoarcus sp.]|jgi:hypothetical protein|nr:sulfotransferase [Azoarcus sp.]
MEKIAIFGVPRSGTSWLSAIFNSHPDVAMRFQPLFSYEHKGRLDERSTGAEIDEFFAEILASRDEFALMHAPYHKNYPRFAKSASPSHIAFKETRYLNIVANMLAQNPGVKVVGIVRNPLATLASWIQLPKEFDPVWNLADEWRAAPGKNQNRPEEFFGFDKWKRSALDFLDFAARYPQQFKWVSYKRLHDDPMGAATELLEFCGLKTHPQVVEFIAQSGVKHDGDDPYSVYRAKADDTRWREILPGFVVDEVRRELAASPLEDLLSE